MKTNSLILGATVLMLATACSNDEVVKVAENSAAIGFSSFVNNSTRADYSSAALPDNLNVYGMSSRAESAEGAGDGVAAFKVFTGTLVTNNGGNWSYSPIQYWIAGNAYTFAAVAPADQENVTVNQTGTKFGGIETIDFSNNGDVDLLYATTDVEAKADAAGYDIVGFNLGHMLSRVRFQFNNDLTEGYTVIVKNVTITDAVKNASYATATNTWTPAETEANGSYAYDMNNAEIPSKGFAQSAHNYIVPTGSAAYNVTFDIELYYTETGKDPQKFETYSHEVTLPAIDYTSGYSYTLVATVNKDNIDPDSELYPIEFTADILEADDWADWTETEVPGFEKTAE